jgi:hypothetical protein
MNGALASPGPLLVSVLYVAVSIIGRKRGTIMPSKRRLGSSPDLNLDPSSRR